jgi:hypothetical protein
MCCQKRTLRKTGRQRQRQRQLQRWRQQEQQEQQEPKEQEQLEQKQRRKRQGEASIAFAQYDGTRGDMVIRSAIVQIIPGKKNVM